MTPMTVDGRVFRLGVSTLADTPRERLDAEAAEIYQIFAEREREFGFGPNVLVEYPPIADPQASPFLADPAGHVAARLAELEAEGPISRVVVLTTFGQQLLAPLGASGFVSARIDMPAGPDHTYAFTLDRAVEGEPARVLYLEAVDEADEKIRPTFVLRLVDGEGQLRGGACGAVHMRDGRRYAYLAMLTLVPGLPPSTGTRLAMAMLDSLRSQGVAVVHLGTQTAGRFYEKLGFRVTHRLVEGLRTRLSGDGRQVNDDLVMLSLEL
ncbi:GNAT family N-acetyltransferase [Kaistia adipata]|uniref:GNAT family N-acetyltransferase n=1 Tax=Kaistia adipata TaxID=166954 RepID=UPI00042A2592|nr:GNAT family N-acetyltransferase [Kaistia adipata]